MVSFMFQFRLWYLVMQSNTDLGVAVKVFCKSEKHLQSADFK